MPSIREESDQPLANGVSEVETSTEPKKVFIDLPMLWLCSINHQRRSYVQHA